ncbi:hypothetical protein [Clostridium tarantellae]|uniref:Uncharacterized protein n=1 Tax=Clostridium tarantellae TaxID=39493 RepID=A0A6I1MHT5_9CLOT|nr:hypothetical protein [Clostridium tarantellae]MPQ42434.1 hypothetical protein [Clostridium tarantellae]
MKVKLIVLILAVTIFSVIIHSNKNNIQVYCENKSKTFQIRFIDLKDSQIELDKKLFNSYSISYIRFDGESYEDICLDLIKTKIPNVYNLDFNNLYKYNNEINGVIKEKKNYDDYNEIKEIPIYNVINT